MSFPPRTRRSEPARTASPSQPAAQSTREIAGAAAVETPNGTGLLDGTGVAPGDGVAVGTCWPPVEGAGAGLPADTAGAASANPSATAVTQYALTGRGIALPGSRSDPNRPLDFVPAYGVS